MKVGLPQFDDDTDLLGRLRQMVATLERAFARIRVDGDLVIGAGQAITKHYSASKTWDPGNVADKASTSTTVSVPGALLGDEVTCSFSMSLTGLSLTGYVSAADTVTCVLSNLSGGAVDLGSGTLRASAWRH